MYASNGLTASKAWPSRRLHGAKNPNYTEETSRWWMCRCPAGVPKLWFTKEPCPPHTSTVSHLARNTTSISVAYCSVLCYMHDQIASRANVRVGAHYLGLYASCQKKLLGQSGSCNSRSFMAFRVLLCDLRCYGTYLHSDTRLLVLDYVGHAQMTYNTWASHHNNPWLTSMAAGSSCVVAGRIGLCAIIGKSLLSMYVV